MCVTHTCGDSRVKRMARVAVLAVMILDLYKPQSHFYTLVQTVRRGLVI